MMDAMQTDQSNIPATDENDAINHATHKENGNLAYQRKQYGTAIDHYTMAIEAASQELSLQEDREHPLASVLASYYGNRAAANKMTSQYLEAIDDCDHAITVDKKATKSHFRKGKVLTILGRLDEALKAYSLGLIHDPNHAQAIKERKEAETLLGRYKLAHELLKEPSQTKKNVRQALSQIELVLATCPSFHAATLCKIDALSRMNRVDEAFALSTQLVSNGYESNDDLIYLRAKCLFYQGNLEGAMKHLRTILSSDPDNKRAFVLLKEVRSLKKLKEEADAAYKTQTFDEAVNLYGSAVEACPPECASFKAKLFFNRALAHNGKRSHKECIADCTEAIGLSDDYTKAYMRRAASYLLIGGKEECSKAIRDYECAEELAKTNEEVRDIRKKIQSAKVQLKRAGRKDLYKLLGVAKDASDSEIKKAYRKMALKFHPDRQKGSEEEKKKAEATFREINLANEILSDPEKKRRYDEGVDEQDIDDPNARPQGHGHGGMGGMGGMDQDILFEMFMRQQSGRRGSPFG